MRQFSGSSGLKPQAEARRYVYAVLVSMLAEEIREGNDRGEGWMFGGVDDPFDRRRLFKAIKAVASEMRRKSTAR